MDGEIAEPTFPPLISGRPLSPATDPFAAAIAAIGAEEAGAGDLYWSQAIDRLDFALVLEPEVAARVAAQVHLAIMVAVGDALGAIAPPEVAVHYRWPYTLLVNGAAAGRFRTGLSLTPDAEAVPGFMVAAVGISIHPGPAASEPGHRPDCTSLWDENCTDIDCTGLLESASRHILAWIDTWQQDGLRPVAEAWMGRAEGRSGELAIAEGQQRAGGRPLGLDDDGNLLIQVSGDTRALSLIECLERF